MTSKRKKTESPFGNGCIIHDIIAVDQWKNLDLVVRPRLFFLSHLHADHTDGLNSTWSHGPVFTSPVNARLAKHFLGSKLSFLVPLELGVPHELPLSQAPDSPTIQVTLLDANHVPGAVMFVFSGYFGNVLYTGDFRYHSKIFNLDVMYNIDTLYLDNTFFFKEYEFPQRAEVINRLTAFLKSQPSDLRIYIGVRRLGKESALVEVANALHERICVTPDRLELFKQMGLPDVFSTDPDDCRIFTVNHNLINRRFLYERNVERPTIAILLTALFYNWPGGPFSSSHLYGLHVFELSDHSSYSELVEFVKRLRPKQIFPIVRGVESKGFLSERRNFLSDRVDLSILRPYLSTDPLPSFDEPEFDRWPPIKFASDEMRRKKAKTIQEKARRPYRGPKGPVYESSTCSSSSSVSKNLLKSPTRNALLSPAKSKPINSPKSPAKNVSKSPSRNGSRSSSITKGIFEKQMNFRQNENQPSSSAKDLPRFVRFSQSSGDHHAVSSAAGTGSHKATGSTWREIVAAGYASARHLIGNDQTAWTEDDDDDVVILDEMNVTKLEPTIKKEEQVDEPDGSDCLTADESSQERAVQTNVESGGGDSIPDPDTRIKEEEPSATSVAIDEIIVNLKSAVDQLQSGNSLNNVMLSIWRQMEDLSTVLDGVEAELAEDLSFISSDRSP